MQKRYLSAIMLVFMLVLQLFAPMKNFVHAEGSATTSDINLKLEAFELRNKVFTEDENGNKIYTYDKVVDELTVIDFEVYDELRLHYTYNLELGHEIAGKTVEFDVPSAFSHTNTFGSSLQAEIGDGDFEIIGSFEFNHQTNKITLTFNEDLDGREVKNAFFRLGLKFNEEKFKETIKQEIDFEELADKTFTVIKKPSSDIEAIEKVGTLNKNPNPTHISWSVDIFNFSVTDRSGIFYDVLPEGLELDKSSFTLTPIVIGIDQENEIKVSEKEVEILLAESFINYDEDTKEIEIDFNAVGLEQDIAAYEGYRVKFSTKITDRTVLSFTNNAEFKFDDSEESIGAETTLSGIKYDKSLEKKVDKINSDTALKWTVDINKSGLLIEDAIVKDILPAGLSIEDFDTDIEIYKIEDGTSGWSVVGNNLYDKDQHLEYDTGNPAELVFKLGNIGQDAYRIIYVTKIDYSQVNEGNYQKVNKFVNDADLFDGNVKLDSDQKEATVNRASIIEKGLTVDHYNNIATWTVYINKAQVDLTGVTFTDVIPNGLTQMGDVIISKWNGTAFVEQTSPIASVSGQTISIDFGNINEQYKVVYQTKISDFASVEDNYINNASLTGGGVGTTDNNAQATYTPASNTFKKEHISTNYSDNTFKWRITVDPKRESLTSLKIDDTFSASSNHMSMTLIENTLKVYVVGTNRVELVRDTDFSLTIKDPATNGFNIEFLDAYFVANGNVLNKRVEVEFSTSFTFDPSEIPTTNNKEAFKNTASYEAETERGYKYTGNASVEKGLKTEAWYSGKKTGRLVHQDGDDLVNEWVSGKTRLIEWAVYTNYLNQKIGGNVVLNDELQFDGKVIKDSVKVYPYVVATNGDTSFNIENPVDASKYEVEQTVDNKITVTFKDEISAPSIYNSDGNRRFVVVFLSEVPDRSQGTYENSATVDLGNTKGLTYKAEAKHAEHNKIIEKSRVGEDSTSGVVYLDDEIDWEITLNESLSIFQAGVEVVDTISKGLVLIRDSIVIVSNGVTLQEGEDKDYKVSISGNSIDGSDETEFSITFNNEINQSIISIAYKTLVVKADINVSNIAKFKGVLEGEAIETERSEFSSETFVDSGGTASTKRAKIKILKLDADDEERQLDASFELYYIVNNSEVRVVEFETSSGEFVTELLPYRTYYLRELSAPKGYVILEEPLEIILNSENINAQKQLVINVENQETLILEKEGVLENDKEVYNKVGDLVDYTITVTNKGEETISDVKITDSMMAEYVAGSIAITVYKADGSIKTNNATNGEFTLEAGEYAVLLGKYAITQKDIDVGSILNEAHATGKYRDLEIETLPDQDEQKGVKEPAIHLKKLIINPKKFENVGDIIEYEFIATNTGNVALYKVVIEDNLVSNLTYVSINGVAVVDPNNITLQPGDVLLAKASYTITQADIEAGKVENHAKVTGEDEEGEEVDSEDDADIDGEQVYKLDLLKTNSITTSNQKEKLDNYSQIGDEIHYVVTATNIGNMIAYNVVVDDIMMKDLVNVVYTHYDKSNVVLATYDDKTIVELTLNPLDRVEMEATYIITQKDLDKGSVLNAASVEYTDEEGEVLGDEEDDTSSVGLSQLALLKVDQKDAKLVLEGAEFTLTHIKSGKRWQLKTDKEGVVVAEGLDFGVYSLEETKAPSGYSLLEEKIEIIIDEDNNGVISLTVENIKEIPEMGDTSYQMAAFVLLLLGLMLIIITKEEKA